MKILINGNEAVAIGALAAGCKFYSAYPMTPSTSIMDYLASKMMDAEIVVEQAEDEIAAIKEKALKTDPIFQYPMHTEKSGTP